MTWEGDALRLLDQRRLPEEEVHLIARDATQVAAAIRDMVVRGAPAIGIAAAYGLALAARSGELEAAAQELAAARPTAVNLGNALERMRAALVGCPPGELAERAAAEAVALHQEDLAINHAMGEAGAALIPPGSIVMTHCNTGSLATGGHGTALGVIRSAYAQGRIERVVAGETRPWLQGSRLTAWELARDGIPVTVMTDSAMPAAMRELGPSWVIVGADRIVANGDTANKIGTYALAVAARHHQVPLMVVAPRSTLDLATPDGAGIPIESRAGAELWGAAAQAEPPPGVELGNPVFDVTPASLIDAIVTERGVHRAPYAQALAGVV